MDVHWAETEVPSAELRVGERVPGFPLRLTQAQAARAELIGNSDSPAAHEVGRVDQPQGLCSNEACVRARSELHGQQALRVDLNVDALSEALSSALATALATALDGRKLSGSASAPAVQSPAPVAVPKRSFWAGAWHADVVLSSIAMLVVVIVLLAWTV